MKKIFSKKAFTLVEMVVALGITTVLIAAVMALFQPVKGIIGTLEDNTDINTTADTINSYMCSKLMNSSTYNIDLYTTDQLTLDGSEESGVAYRVANIVADQDPTNEKTYCMVIKFAGGGYRLYDLGVVTSASDYLGKVSSSAISDYKLFQDAFYNDINYKFTFKTTSDTSGATNRKWCKVGVVAYDNEGELISTERSQMFKLINMSATGVTPSSNADLENVSDYSDGSHIVVIYRLKNYSVI